MTAGENKAQEYEKKPNAILFFPSKENSGNIKKTW